ncbi:osmoprotectant ABC transporter substrate-binding protein [Lactovum odontotermitis]
MKKLGIAAFLFIFLFGFLAYRNISEQTEDTITVNGGVTSESQIIGNMIAELIQHESDYHVKFLNNLVSAQVDQVAMERGELSIASVRYTGTDLVTTLGKKIIKDHEKALKVVQSEFASRYDQEWYPSYGFANEFAFMVTKETAQKYHLTKISDLQKFSDKMKLGVDSGWYEREGDGYKAFTKAYQMKFGRVYPMQVGLLYNALHAEKYDVVLGYSTDGRISSYGLVTLEDDRHFFPPYDCSLVVDKKVLKKYPKLEALLHRLDGKIDTRTMQKLNYESDGKLIEPELIARKFLQEHHYFRNAENSSKSGRSDERYSKE